MTHVFQTLDPARRTVKLGAGGMSFLEWSGGGPQLLFAHANGFNAQTYRALLAPLANLLPIAACDLRGHGFSTLPTGDGLAKDWYVFRDDLIAAIRHLRTSVVLAGHSLGATASLMAAAAAPELVRALLLIEPVLIPPLPEVDNARADDLAGRASRRRGDFPSFDAAFDAYRGRGIFASWPDDVVADYLRGGLIETGDGSLRLACAPEWEAAIFRGAPRDRAPLAAQIPCPITIVAGTCMSATSEQQLSVFRSIRPDLRIVSVDGASHFIPMERPDIVRGEILRLARIV